MSTTTTGPAAVTSKLVEIRNISSVLDENHLRELFECCGSIQSLEMRRGGVGRVCLIEFENTQEAEAAALLTGTQLGDLALTVERKSVEDVVKLKEESKQMAQRKEAEGEVAAALRKIQELAAPAEGQTAAPLGTPIGGTGNNLVGAGMSAGGVDAALQLENKRRDDELARTIYVGNLNPLVTETHIKAVFKSCGEVLYLKMSTQCTPAHNQGQTTRYCFLEFDSAEAAQRAFQLHGTPLGDRPLKIGPVTSPIVKTTQSSSSNILSNPMRLRNAMEHVRSALGKLEQRKGKGSDSSRSRSRGRRRRRRSRSRSRSRKRRRRRRSRSSRSRSRSRERRRDRAARLPVFRRGGGGGGGHAAGNKKSEKDMIWDGFQWHPRESREGQATVQAVQKSTGGIVASQREFRDWAPAAALNVGAELQGGAAGPQTPGAAGVPPGPETAGVSVQNAIQLAAAQAVKQQQQNLGMGMGALPSGHLGLHF